MQPIAILCTRVCQINATGASVSSESLYSTEQHEENRKIRTRQALELRLMCVTATLLRKCLCICGIYENNVILCLIDKI